MSAKRAKRGRKSNTAIENEPGLRNHTITVNEKVCVPSTSLFPCRPLEEAPLPIVNAPRIKKEAEEPVIKQEVTEDDNGCNSVVLNTKHVFSVSHLNEENSPVDSSVDCITSSQTCEEAENCLDIGSSIKRERSSSTETVVADVPVQEIPEDSDTVMSSSNERPVGITNEVVDSSVDFTASGQTCEAAENLDIGRSIKRERSSSTDIELADEPVQKIPEDMVSSSSNKRPVINEVINQVTKKMKALSPLADCATCEMEVDPNIVGKTDTLSILSTIKSTIMDLEKNYSVEIEKSCSTLKEETSSSAHTFPIRSTDSPSTISTDNKYKNFIKIMNLNIEINSNDVKDCQIYLKEYTRKNIKKKFQLFFNNDRSEAQHDKSATESLKLLTDSLSTEDLKKILQNLPKDSESLTNISIKKEPLDFTHSTATKDLMTSEGLKRSFEEDTVTAKKIKTEPSEKIHLDAVPLDHTVPPVIPSKVSTSNRSTVPQRDLCVNNDPRASRLLNNPSVNNDFLLTHNINGKSIDSAPSKSITSDVPSYLHLVPNICKSSSSLEDKCPNEANTTPTYERINPLDWSQPIGTSSNSTTAKRKITPKDYLERRALRDPRLMKNRNTNLSQASSPGISVPTLTFTANSMNTHQYSKAMSAFNTSNVPHKYLENSVSLQNLSVTSESKKPTKLVSCIQNQEIAKNSKAIKNQPRKEPGRTKSTFSKPLRINQSSTLLRNKIGKDFIETSHFPYCLLEWNAEWLLKQQTSKVCPSISDGYLHVRDTYENEQDYYNTYLPLHLLNIWLQIYHAWEKSDVLYKCEYVQKEDMGGFAKLTCSIFCDTDNLPKKDDILLCLPDNHVSKQRFFGQIDQTFKSEKHTFLKITCININFSPGTRIDMFNLMNLRLAVQQNIALRYINKSIKALVLNPRNSNSLVQAVPVSQFNVPFMKRSLYSSHHRVTLVETRSSLESSSTIFQISTHLQSDTIVLIGVKDVETFVRLALQMINQNIILAISKYDFPLLPHQLHKFLVTASDPRTLTSCRIVLTLVSAAFFGDDLQKRLASEPVMCIIHEAQCLYETETALLFLHRVEHLILVGRSEKTVTHPILMRYGFDRSLFHRILEVN